MKVESGLMTYRDLPLPQSMQRRLKRCLSDHIHTQYKIRKHTKPSAARASYYQSPPNYQSQPCCNTEHLLYYSLSLSISQSQSLSLSISLSLLSRTLSLSICVAESPIDKLKSVRIVWQATWKPLSLLKRAVERV